MDYSSYVNQQNPSHHPGTEYVHQAPPHSQHGVYQQSLPVHHQSQAVYHPHYSQQPMPVDHAQPPSEITRRHGVVAVTNNELESTLHEMHRALAVHHQNRLTAPGVSSRLSTPQPAPSNTNIVPSTNAQSLPISSYVTVEISAAPSRGPSVPPETNLAPEVTAENSMEEPQEAVEEPLGGPLPPGLRYEKLGENSVCVVADQMIPEGVRFGPFKGAFGKGPVHFNNMLSWELTLEGKVVGFISPLKGEKAWTTLVRCADNVDEMTGVVSQHCGRIYYTTIRQMHRGEELKVFYADDYRESCGFKLGLADLKYHGETDSFECSMCPAHCKTAKSLLRHMKVFHEKEKRSNIDISLSMFKDNDQEVLDGEPPPGEEGEGAQAQYNNCNYCGKKLSTQGRLLIHLKKFHKKEQFGDEDDHCCMVCGFVCPDQLHLDQHLQKHKTAKHGCDKCGMVFSKTDLMLKHKRDKHPELFGQNKLKIKLRMRKKTGKNTCKVCGYTCLDAEDLIEHLEKHKKLPFGCLECGSLYLKKGNLLKHLQEKHSTFQEKDQQAAEKGPVNTNFRCEDCFYYAPSEEEYAEHREKHKIGLFGCDECGLVYTRKNYVDRHKRTKHGAPSDSRKRNWFAASECPWSCQECNKSCVNLKALKKHQRYKHGKLSEPKYSVDRAALEGSGNFECELCIATFTKGDEFQEHLLEGHSMEFLAGEDKAKKRTLVLKDLTVRSTRAHKTAAVHKPEVDPTPKAGQILCYICGHGFEKYNLLNDHLRQHHGLEPVSKTRLQGQETSASMQNVNGTAPTENSVSGEQVDMLGKPLDYYTRPRPFKCSECEKRFVTRNGMKRHLNLYHLGSSKYPCTFCSKGFDQEAQFLIHMQTHTKKRPFQCHQCPRSFASQNACDNHQSEHTDEKPFPCDVCNKWFKTKKYRNRHKFRVHSTKERRYKCSFCGKGFHSGREFRLHEQRHRGIRPYVCITCGKAFKDRHCREVHYKMHTGEKPYKCHLCNKAFPHSYRLTNHIVKHTKENMEQAAAVSNLANNPT